jgi:MFS family permease
MNSSALPSRPTKVRYGVLAFACVLSMITYLDRVCFGSVADDIKREFGLDDFQKGLLFTAFAFAYAAFEVPSGALGDLFGARKTLIRIVLWWSAFTALTGCIWPFRVELGPIVITSFAVLLLVRFLFGAGEAGAYPNISRAFHSWFPFSERGSAQGAVWMAGRFGGGITPLVVLALVFSVTGPDGAKMPYWRHIFWIFGALGVMWCFAFVLWFRDRPEDHPSVNEAELALIRGTPAVTMPELGVASAKLADKSLLPASGPDKDVGITEQRPPAADAPGSPGEHDESHSNIPWRKLIGFANLWVLCLMYFCGAYGWYFNITWLPGYLKDTYGVTPETHGFWTSSLLKGAPLLFGAMACLVGGLLTDWFIRRTGNRKWGRRLFGVIGHGVCALCYFLTLTAGNAYVFVLFVALASFWNDITMGSAWASCIDIGKRYSGIVSGCMNTVGNLGGAAAGFLGGLILKEFGETLGWRINLISFGIVYVIAVGLWLLFDATKPLIEDEPGVSATLTPDVP